MESRAYPPRRHSSCYLKTAGRGPAKAAAERSRLSKRGRSVPGGCACRSRQGNRCQLVQDFQAVAALAGVIAMRETIVAPDEKMDGLKRRMAEAAIVDEYTRRVRTNSSIGLIDAGSFPAYAPEMTGSGMGEISRHSEGSFPPTARRDAAALGKMERSDMRWLLAG